MYTVLHWINLNDRSDGRRGDFFWLIPEKLTCKVDLSCPTCQEHKSIRQPADQTNAVHLTGLDYSGERV